MEIDTQAFSSCENLTKAIFQGNALPHASSIFSASAPDFTVFYYEGSNGFTSPVWESYPATAVPSTVPQAARIETLSLTRGTDFFSLVVSGKQGWSYQLQRSQQPGGGWETVAGSAGVLAMDRELELKDAGAAADRGFYRVTGMRP